MARNQLTYTDRGIPVLRSRKGLQGDAWTCSLCGSLLGRIKGHDVHLRFNRRHEYVATLPASATCRKCGTLNQARMADPA